MSDCRHVRDRLTSAPQGPLPPSVRRHLEGCAACRSFEERSRALAEALGEPRSRAVPDAGFAARVMSRLPSAPDAATTRFTWAAVRLLPAAVALLLVLLGWSVIGSGEDPALGDPDVDVLTWILDPSAAGPEADGSERGAGS